jgi:hypothetical protein
LMVVVSNYARDLIVVCYRTTWTSEIADKVPVPSTAGLCLHDKGELHKYWGKQMKRKAIPSALMKRILTRLRAAIKSTCTDEKSENEFSFRFGMLEGFNAVEAKLRTWTKHQENISKLKASGQKRRVTKAVTLSEGRYRKYEWYEGKKFFSLAFRWGKEQPNPEIGLEIENVDTLDYEFLVYEGDLNYDDLMRAAENSGIRGIWGGKKTGDWKPLELKASQ